MSRRILFVSGLVEAPWGAAEELWQQTALELAGRAHAVSASVRRWQPRPAPVAELLEAGIEVEERDGGLGTACLRADNDLVVLQQPDVFAVAPWMSHCRASGRPYVTLTHYGALHEWPDDDVAMALRQGFRAARMNYFISEAIADLVERQTAQRLVKREIVRAPYKVPYEAPRPWPAENGTLRIACVGRLDLADKGQDTLIRALAQPDWRRRPAALSIYGSGRHARLVEAMIEHLDACHVSLRGETPDVAAIWDSHHVLALASRAEGLPAVIVEAMLCGRPVLVTDVGGNAELLRDGETGFLSRTPGDEDVGSALERLWQARAELPRMGAAAAREIRRLVPPEPARVFADRLLRAADGAEA